MKLTKIISGRGCAKLSSVCTLALLEAAVLLPLGTFGDALTLGNEMRSHLPFIPSPLRSVNGDLTVMKGSSVITWNFEDAASPLADAFGHGADMSASASAPSVVNDATRGNVLSFDGTQYLNGPGTDAGFDYLPAGGTNIPFSVACWIKPDANCVSNACVFCWGNMANGQLTLLRLRPYAIKSLLFATYGGDLQIEAPSVRDGEWHHIAVSYAGNRSFEVYYDVTNKTTHTISRDHKPPNKNFYIGQLYPGAATDFANYTGLLDDFVVVDYAMTAEDVAALAAGSVPNGAAPDVALDWSGSPFVTNGTTAFGTLSGSGVLGGVEGVGATVIAGEGVSAATSGVYSAMLRGDAAQPISFVKRGANYTQVLSGIAENVTNVMVEAGELTVRRPLARRGLLCRYAFDDADDVGYDAGPGGVKMVKVGTAKDDIASVASGVSGRALHFPRTAYLNTGTAHLPSRFPSGNDSYTVSVWIRPTTEACMTDNGCIYRWGLNAAAKYSMVRFYNSNNKLFFSSWGKNLTATTASTLDDGNWHHVVLTYDGDTLYHRLYCDGEEIGTLHHSSALSLDGGRTLAIGYCAYSGKNFYYSGDMDEFMMFDYAWTADEVRGEYARKPAEPVAAETLLPAPVGHWTFDDAENLGADSSGNGLDLTVEDGTVEAASDSLACGGAVRFTESGYLTRAGYSPLFPKGTNAFTIICRYKSNANLSTSANRSVVSIGGAATSANISSGNIVKVGPGAGKTLAARYVAGDTYTAPANTGRSADGTDRQRWVTAAITYAPVCAGTTNVYHFYLDGVKVASKTSKGRQMDIVDERFDIGSDLASGGGRSNKFLGLVDDVQVFDRALSAGEVDLITRRLAAGAGKAAQTTPKVLPETVKVTVAADAKLTVSADETVDALAGAGTVEISPLASLTVTDMRGFTGSLAGYGTITVGKGATLNKSRVTIANTLTVNVLGTGMTIIIR